MTNLNRYLDFIKKNIVNFKTRPYPTLGLSNPSLIKMILPRDYWHPLVNLSEEIRIPIQLIIVRSLELKIIVSCISSSSSYPWFMVRTHWSPWNPLWHSHSTHHTHSWASKVLIQFQLRISGTVSKVGVQKVLHRVIISFRVIISAISIVILYYAASYSLVPTDRPSTSTFLFEFFPTPPHSPTVRP